MATFVSTWKEFYLPPVARINMIVLTREFDDEKARARLKSTDGGYHYLIRSAKSMHQTSVVGR
jgi:hypothetical protein